VCAAVLAPLRNVLHSPLSVAHPAAAAVYQRYALCVRIRALLLLLLLVCVHTGVEDVDTAMQAARKAFDEGPWPRMGGKVRGLGSLGLKWL
jgi:hypothetical protein